MTSDVLPAALTASAAEADDLVASLRPRLVDAVGAAEVDRLIREALADLGAVRVTTYLPILIERRVRQQVRTAPTVAAVDAIDVRVARVTA
jgi:hypothetical protein